jgi:hypothetical protein
MEREETKRDNASRFVKFLAATWPTRYFFVALLAPVRDVESFVTRLEKLFGAESDPIRSSAICRKSTAAT